MNVTHSDARALVHLLNAESIVQQGPEMYDIGAEELRISCRVLDTLIGRVDVRSLWMRFFQAFVLESRSVSRETF